MTLSALASTGTTKQIKLNLLFSVLLVVAIYGGNASASRLLPEDHDFSISRAAASKAALDLKLNFVVDGSGSQRPKVHSDEARSNSPRDGMGNALDASDVARPGGLNSISAEAAELSLERKDIHRRTRRSSSSGYNNNIAEELVFNALSKGPIHEARATATETRLSASNPSSAAHMQIRYARTINTMLRSEHKHGSRQMQEISQRILTSSPSPGDGN